LAPAPIAREDIVEPVLTLVVVLLIRCIVEFLIKATVGEHVADEFAWIVEPAVIFCCLSRSGSFSAGRVIMEIVTDCKALPSKIAVWGGVDDFVHVISVGERRRGVEWYQ
jgi:hypothetical protein